MFDLGSGGEATRLGMVRAAAAAVAGIGEADGDGERIDLLRALEELKCVAEGAQAVLTAAFDASQREQEAAVGVPVERRGRAVAAQVALARRESPHRGRQHLGLAVALAGEMPGTAAALGGGQISEWRAMLLARETACMSREDRGLVDRRLAGTPQARAQLEGMGDRQLVALARELAYGLDPVSFVERRRRAEADRHVSLRAAPEVMAQLSALVPVKDGVAVWAVLSRAADQARAAGDPRSRGQVMADTLVHRILTPTATIAPEDASSSPSSPSSPVRLMIDVVVPDSVLLGDEHGFGWVRDYGPVPGDLLREWIAATAEAGVEQWVRRLYVTPASGELVSMDSQARRFEGKLAEFLRLRDRVCRTAWCEAPVRHLDHPRGHAEGGPTSAANGQGLCEDCNYAKQAPGWSARPRPGPRHTIETTTPTGHRYTSTAPAQKVTERGLRIALLGMSA
ncbi:MAG TPA: DUF222 domain-containing protein [Nocardioides sp.]|uniref:HNH endonuclease n=1 Tax=Nocardioides sp. TaxID=35761 RepID=UPI002E350AD5|nr:DUF222 domain-containing protein [Nocardioides sp.]HEX5087112.1 DUF222 domain-containing protein [Nocardioides sp.]